jgi:hypothetical protein
MKSMTMVMRWVALTMFLFACLSVAAYGQNARLRIDSLSHLEANAVDITDISVDEQTLKLGWSVLSTQRSTDEAKIRELLKGLKGVYVKVLEFDKDNAYSQSDLEDVRTQLRAPGWVRIVNVRSKRDGDNVEAYLMSDGDKIQGVGVIVANSHEVAIVNVVGPIDLEKIGELEGQFGIPRLGLDFGKWSK